MPNPSNAQKLIDGLEANGYIVHGASCHILRYHGQGMMNKAAGEAAPTWKLLANPMWRLGEVIRNGQQPTVRLPSGKVISNVDIGSHLPLTYIIRHKPSLWDVDYKNYYGMEEIRIYVPDLPESWR